MPIKHIKTKDFNAVYMALQKLEQTISTKLLVRLKNMLYDFVVNNKANDKIYVGDIKDIDDDKLDKIQAVFGIGVADMYDYGYRSITPEDIFKDILSNNTDFDVDKLFNLTYPSIFKNLGYLPIYKYLKIKSINSLAAFKLQYPLFEDSIFNKLQRINFNTLLPPSNYAAHKIEVNQCSILEELITKYDAWHALLYIQLLDHDKIDLDLFRNFLITHFDSFYSKTEFRKAVCLYDILSWTSQNQKGKKSVISIKNK